MDAGRRDGEWLDLVADVLTARPDALPVDRIAVALATTLNSAVCALTISDGRHRCLAWRLLDCPGPTFERSRPGGWEPFFHSLGADHHLTVPVGVGSGRITTFVLGRAEPFTAEEVDFSVTLRRILAGTDRHRGGGRTDIHGVSRVNGGRARRLTPRETAVLALMSAGMTAGAAARRLAIAERTVHKHLERTYRKLDVSDCLSAVLRAQRLGLLD